MTLQAICEGLDQGPALCHAVFAHERLHFGAVIAPGNVSLPLPPHRRGLHFLLKMLRSNRAVGL